MSAAFSLLSNAPKNIPLRQNASKCVKQTPRYGRVRCESAAVKPRAERSTQTYTPFFPSYHKSTIRKKTRELSFLACINIFFSAASLSRLYKKLSFLVHIWLFVRIEKLDFRFVVFEFRLILCYFPFPIWFVSEVLNCKAIELICK